MLLPLFLLAATMPPTIDDESKVPPYTLPDPLVDNAGHKVVDAKQWRESRRPEVMKLVEENIFGRTPDTRERQQAAVAEVVESDDAALGGKATRTQLKVWPVGKAGPAFDLLVYVPKAAKGPAPAFLGLNFGGNHTTVEDKAVRLLAVEPASCPTLTQGRFEYDFGDTGGMTPLSSPISNGRTWLNQPPGGIVHADGGPR